MIKRVAALFFILIANIILLAHVAVSHHHHKSKVCIVSSHCQTDSEAHKHNTTEHNHEHDGDNNSEYCALNQVVVIRSNQVKHEFKYFNCADNNTQIDDFQAVLFDKGLYDLFPTVFSNVQLLLLSSAYSCFVSTGLGLRAPPIV